MPIYEYMCQSCQEHFEIVQRFNDKPLRKCSSCGGRLQKLISQSSFHLKGSGWYVTDYAKKGSKPAEADEKRESAPAESKSAPPGEKPKKKEPASDE